MELPAPLPHLHLGQHHWTVRHWLPDAGSDADLVDLDAPYQRGDVWDDTRRANLVRSLLMQVPTGAVTYSHTDDGRYRVIDGKQRIGAVRAFCAGELEVPGWWFHPAELADDADRAAAVTWEDLTPAARLRFTNLALPGLEFDPGTEWVRGADGTGWERRQRPTTEAIAAEAELYLLVNFGGVAQSDVDADRAAAVARAAR